MQEQEKTAAATAAADAEDSARTQRELENERELVRRLKDRVQLLLQEKKDLRADLQVVFCDYLQIRTEDFFL